MSRILVVEDDSIQRDLVRALLELDGHRVEEAGSGPEALARMEAEPPDLLVTDHLMPGMDGREMVRRIRRIPRLARIPVILCSAMDEDRLGIGNPGERSGVRLLRKPFTGEQLTTLVREVVAASSGRAAPAGRGDREPEGGTDGGA